MKIIVDKVTNTSGVYHAYIQVIDETANAIYVTTQLDWNPAQETGQAFRTRVADTLRPIIAKIKDVETKKQQLQTLLDNLKPDNL
jgi:adenine-specific DNA methylase